MCTAGLHTRYERKEGKMQLSRFLFLILAFGAGSVFADDAVEEAGEEEAVERICVNKRNINSFDAIDDQHLYIRATGNRHYLFTMWSRCWGLRNAYGIGIKDTMSRVCSKGFGEIVYRDIGRRFQTCKIDTIETVASKDDARGLVADRKRAKEEDRAKDD
jgi:hypothetical protein